MRYVLVGDFCSRSPVRLGIVSEHLSIVTEGPTMQVQARLTPEPCFPASPYCDSPTGTTCLCDLASKSFTVWEPSFRRPGLSHAQQSRKGDSKTDYSLTACLYKVPGSSYDRLELAVPAMACI
jgi:hypothetical protein